MTPVGRSAEREHLRSIPEFWTFMQFLSLGKRRMRDLPTTALLSLGHSHLTLLLQDKSVFCIRQVKMAERSGA